MGPDRLAPRGTCIFTRVMSRIKLPGNMFGLMGNHNSIVKRRLTTGPGMNVIDLAKDIRTKVRAVTTTSTGIAGISLRLKKGTPNVMVPSTSLSLTMGSVVTSHIVGAKRMYGYYRHICMRSDVGRTFLRGLLTKFGRIGIKSPGRCASLSVNPLVSTGTLGSMRRGIGGTVRRKTRLLYNNRHVNAGKCFFRPAVLVGYARGVSVVRRRAFKPMLPIIRFARIRSTVT